jgi:hypothetical protein
MIHPKAATTSSDNPGRIGQKNSAEKITKCFSFLAANEPIGDDNDDTKEQ